MIGRMAWAEKLPSGKWRGCWRDTAGKRCTTGKSTHPEHPFARKRDAIEAAQEAEVASRRRASAARGVTSGSITWGEWWDLLSPEYPHSDTGQTVASIVRLYLTPRWGDTELTGIESRDLKAWVADLSAKAAASYVRRIYGVFRWSINQAMDRGVLAASPCAGVKLPKVPKRAKAYIDSDYLEAVRPHLAVWHADITELGLETGLRPGEACGLHANEVDLTNGWITLSTVLVGRSKVIRPWPKDKDARQIPLTDRAVEIIRRNLAGRELTVGCGMRHLDDRTCRSELVMRGQRGCVITPQAWYWAISRAASKAGVEVRSPYAARRGFGTRAGHGGMDVFELAEIMGHASVDQTAAYVQATPSARERMRRAMGEPRNLTAVPDPEKRGSSAEKVTGT